MDSENFNSKINKHDYEPMKSSDFLKTLERGLHVIKSFKDKPQLTISEASKLTELPRPVTRRILLTLEKLGYTKSKGGRFSLTPKILSLGYSYFSSQNIWEIATPHLEQLSKIIKESSSLAILEGTDIVYVARVSVNKIMNHSLVVGTRLPAHATSSGKVLLSNLSVDELDAYFQQTKLEAYTEKTITSEKEIREELKRVRKMGYAISQEQLELGLISVAAPVKDITGKVVAAVNCPTHTGRNNVDRILNEFLPLLLKVTKGISNEIDFEIIQ